MPLADVNPVAASSGKTPEQPLTPQPLDLPRLVMQRAAIVALGCLLLALALGMARAREDTQEELESAMAMARISQRLATLGDVDDAQLFASLESLNVVRHLQLRIDDDTGRTLWREELPAPPGPPLAWLIAIHRAIVAPVPPQSVSWSVRRPGGREWTMWLTASPDSEQREALASLLDMFALLAGCSLLMLAVMHWNVRHAFAPLQRLLAAIARIERQDLGGVASLPRMPIRELEAISSALKHLASSLQQAEDARRVLAHKVMSLQEDERQRLARDLHDEFGQRLTALRADAAWLRKRLADDARLETVAAGMNEQIAHIQQDVRGLLHRLRPLGGHGHRDADAPDNAASLQALLQNLLAGWRASPTHRTRLELSFTVVGGGDASSTSPAALQSLALPRELVLAVYRITQEALTNVTRHARAGTARVEVRIEPAGALHGVLHWSVQDDGIGLSNPAAALQQGNGLAGMKERVWALGGEFAWQGDRGGLRLHARIPFGAPHTGAEADAAAQGAAT
jgi:two-component system sensor histidine kinase UhpB